MLKLALALLAIVATAAQAEQHRCISPGELTFHAYRTEWNKQFRANFFIEYDRNNKRMVVFGDEHRGKVPRQREYLFLYERNVGYDIDLENKKCKKFDSGKFHPIEVAPNATFEGQFNIGDPLKAITIERWAKRLDSGRFHYFQDFTLERCYPVYQFLADEKNFNHSETTDMFDLSVGIENPDDFDVPSYCNEEYVQNVGQITPGANRVLSIFSNSLYNY